MKLVVSVFSRVIATMLIYSRYYELYIAKAIRFIDKKFLAIVPIEDYNLN